jgi:hypothetical protein
MRHVWMTHLFGSSVCAWAILGLASLAAGPTSSALTPESLASLHALIKPQSGEDKWMQIPWRTSLTEARQQAAVAGKPILLWEMDGHPLGCT